MSYSLHHSVYGNLQCKISFLNYHSHLIISDTVPRKAASTVNWILEGIQQDADARHALPSRLLAVGSRALVSHGTLDVNNSTNDLPLVQLHQITERFKIYVNKSRRLRNALHQKVFPACNPRRRCIGCHCPPQPHPTVSESGST